MVSAVLVAIFTVVLCVQDLDHDQCTVLSHILYSKSVFRGFLKERVVFLHDERGIIECLHAGTWELRRLHSLGNLFHSETTYQSEFSFHFQFNPNWTYAQKEESNGSVKLVELQSRLELDKLNDSNSIMVIMRMS